MFGRWLLVPLYNYSTELLHSANVAANSTRSIATRRIKPVPLKLLAPAKKKKKKKVSERTKQIIKKSIQQAKQPPPKTKLKPYYKWKGAESQLKYMDWLASQLNIQKQEDWYQVKSDTIRKYNGCSIINLYGSVIKVLAAVYPQFKWEPWRFEGRASTNFWSKVENHRNYFDWLAEELQIDTQEEWYYVNLADVTEHSGHGLIITHYRNSMIQALMEVYPEFTWYPWKFAYTPKRFFDDPLEKRKLWDWLGEELDVKTLDDWYNVSSNDVQALANCTMTQGFLYETLKEVYPEHNWQAWKFQRVPLTYWSNVAAQQEYFDWLYKTCGLKSMSDWYTISMRDLKQRLPSESFKLLYRKYSGSVSTAVMTVYPNHKWFGWLFPEIPHGYWHSKDNQRLYLDWLATVLRIKKPEDWKKVTKDDIVRTKGYGLLEQYKGSLTRSLRGAYGKNFEIPTRLW